MAYAGILVTATHQCACAPVGHPSTSPEGTRHRAEGSSGQCTRQAHAVCFSIVIRLPIHPPRHVPYRTCPAVVLRRHNLQEVLVGVRLLANHAAIPAGKSAMQLSTVKGAQCKHTWPIGNQQGVHMVMRAHNVALLPCEHARCAHVGMCMEARKGRIGQVKTGSRPLTRPAGRLAPGTAAQSRGA